MNEIVKRRVSYLSATELRELACKEDNLAILAKSDGDYGYALKHESLAADYREAAREKEVG